MTPSLKRDTWQQHIQAWQQSQLSKKAYCREHNLNSACFYKWHSKLSLKPAAPQESDSTSATIQNAHGRLFLSSDIFSVSG